MCSEENKRRFLDYGNSILSLLCWQAFKIVAVMVVTVWITYYEVNLEFFALAALATFAIDGVRRVFERADYSTLAKAIERSVYNDERD